MSFAEFLENESLYKKSDFKVPPSRGGFRNVQISMKCSKCGELRTFDHHTKDVYSSLQNYLISSIVKGDPRPFKENDIITLGFICAYCHDFYRFFSLRVGKNCEYFEKVGQYPPWDISIERYLEKILKKFSVTEYYKKGLICEEFSNGIGANIYYRRVIEEIIDELAEQMVELLEGENKELFINALEEAKRRKNGSEKIDLIKDYLPSILREVQENPLLIIYDILSTGIHEKTDKECLIDAMKIRNALGFIIEVVSRSRVKKREYERVMKDLNKIHQ